MDLTLNAKPTRIAIEDLIHACFHCPVESFLVHT